MNAIERAMQIFTNRDWTYMMVDYGYERKHYQAKMEMREFVMCCNKVEDKEKKEALRELWTLKYDYINTLIGGYNNKGITDSEYEKSEKNLLSKLGLA